MSHRLTSDPSDDRVGQATQQLIKARLRHFLYLSMAVPGDPKEGMWRSLLSWQDDLLSQAENDWLVQTSRYGPPTLSVVQRALPAAVTDVVDTISAQRAALGPLVRDFVDAFDPRPLTGLSRRS